MKTKDELKALQAKTMAELDTDLKSPFAGRGDRRRNDRGPRGERRDRNDRPERKEGGK